MSVRVGLKRKCSDDHRLTSRGLPWVGLQCVIVVFPDHTQLLFALWWQTLILREDIFHPKLTQKASEYDEEIPQSHTADQPTARWRRATEHLQADN